MPPRQSTGGQLPPKTSLPPRTGAPRTKGAPGTGSRSASPARSEPDDNPFSDAAERQRHGSRGNDGPEGIGGWLLLPILHLILVGIVSAIALFAGYLPLFANGEWEQRTTPGTEVYHAAWASVMLFEITMLIVLGVMAVALLVLCFMKHSLCPKLMIAFYALNVLFRAGDFVLARELTAAENGLSVIDKALIRAVIAAAFWIPYFLVSKRVANTFRN